MSCEEFPSHGCKVANDAFSGSYITNCGITARKCE